MSVIVAGCIVSRWPCVELVRLWYPDLIERHSLARGCGDRIARFSLVLRFDGGLVLRIALHQPQSKQLLEGAAVSKVRRGSRRAIVSLAPFERLGELITLSEGHGR